MDEEPRTATSTSTQLLSFDSFVSTETIIKTVRDGESGTATWTFTQLLSSDSFVCRSAPSLTTLWPSSLPARSTSCAWLCGQMHVQPCLGTCLKLTGWPRCVSKHARSFYVVLVCVRAYSLHTHSYMRARAASVHSHTGAQHSFRQTGTRM